MHIKYGLVLILEDIINPIDPNKPSSSSSFTRLLLTRAEFSCIIGRGGLNVTKIRSTCGAFIQGCDIDDQNRLVRFLLIIASIYTLL